MKALIVEDDPNLTLLWESTLRGRGHDLEFCQSKGAALKMLSAGGFDLVVLDLTLADGTGLGLLHALDPKSTEPAVLIVTGSADFRNGELFALSPRVRAVMRKPVDVEDMIDVAEYLGQAKAALPSNRLDGLPIEIRT